MAQTQQNINGSCPTKWPEQHGERSVRIHDDGESTFLAGDKRLFFLFVTTIRSSGGLSSLGEFPCDLPPETQSHTTLSLAKNKHP